MLSGHGIQCKVAKYRITALGLDDFDGLIFQDKPCRLKFDLDYTKPTNAQSDERCAPPLAAAAALASNVGGWCNLGSSGALPVARRLRKWSVDLGLRSE